MRRLAALLGSLLALLLPGPASPCTAFEVPRRGGGHFVGQSYDWHQEDGLVVLNRKGVAKRSFSLGKGEQLAWTSRHASVTFDQYGLEHPTGGMNDAGLVVAVLWLDSSTYPPASDPRPALDELQWIQYHLDLHATVAEMIEDARRLRVRPIYAKVHYFACDAGGTCAAFEYVGGRLVTTTGAKMPYPVLTNHTYAASRRFVDGGAKVKGRGSLARFAIAARSAARGARSADDVFGLLEAVRTGDYTKWQIVYDPKTLTVFFRSKDHRAVKSISLESLDTSCAKPPRALDMATDRPGPAAFSEDVEALHRALLHRTLGPLAPRVPPAAAEALIRAVGAETCAASSAR